MASQARRGKVALDSSNYEEAIKEYTAAIKESPTSPDFYIQRSLANLRANHVAESLADAEHAVINAMNRAKKEAVTEAQFRRGVALYKLGRLGDARSILLLVKERDEKHKQADLWINKTTMEMQKLAPDDEKLNVTVEFMPRPEAAPKPAATSPPAPAVQPQPTPAEKIRYEWYQNNDSIYFTLLAKGVPKDKAQIEVTEQALNICFPILGDTHKEYSLTLEPLFATVVPEKGVVRVLPSKVEIVLVKHQPGQKWAALEGTPEPAKLDSVAGSEAKDSKADEAIKRAVFNEPAKGPAYPTSSKSGPKDWDKVASEQLKAGRSGDTKEGSLEDDEDYEGGDPANHFFQKLFKGSSPDVQRAMMKSYTESNGTSLSTNWEEVSKGKVETVPPEGMEAKQYSK